MSRILLVCVILAVFSACRRVDERSFTVSIPALSESNMKLIASSLSQYAGIDHASVKFDLEHKTMFLKYDSMQLAKKNIEMSIAAAGYEANGVTPESVGAMRK